MSKSEQDRIAEILALDLLVAQRIAFDALANTSKRYMDGRDMGRAAAYELVGLQTPSYVDLDCLVPRSFLFNIEDIDTAETFHGFIDAAVAVATDNKVTVRPLAIDRLSPRFTEWMRCKSTRSTLSARVFTRGQYDETARIDDFTPVPDNIGRLAVFTLHQPASAQ